MKALFILNDPPYGSERVYNALRLAQALLKKDPQTQLTQEPEHSVTYSNIPAALSVNTCPSRMYRPRRSQPKIRLETAIEKPKAHA